FKQRCMHEHADALWVVGTHETENDARFDEVLLSLKYGLPTLPFVPRKGKAVNGLVHDETYIGRLFREIDTAGGATRPLADRKLRTDEPHHVPRSRNSVRRNVVVTLCGDCRGSRPMHRVSVSGNDIAGRRALETAGFVVRAAKRSLANWIVETVRADFGEAAQLAQQACKVLDGRMILKANLHGRSLPFVTAQCVKPGMVMVAGDGQAEIVESARSVPGMRQPVFDLDVSPTHNYVANDVVTHNSIYRFRGAEVGNMNEFVRDFDVKEVVKLEQNYRSQGHILDAANAIIAQNKARLGKNLWTEAA